MGNFRLGEYVGHVRTGRLGHVNAFGSEGIAVYWDGTYHPMGAEIVPRDDLISLEHLAEGEGHFDQIRHLAALAAKAVEVIDTVAKDALERGWYTEDTQPMFRALRALDTLRDRITSQVYQAEAEGRN